MKRSMLQLVILLLVVTLVASPAYAFAPVKSVRLVAEYALPSGDLVREFEVQLEDGTVFISGDTLAFNEPGKSAFELKQQLIREGKGYLLALPPGTEIAEHIIRQWQNEGYDWRIERESAARLRPDALHWADGDLWLPAWLVSDMLEGLVRGYVHDLGAVTIITGGLP